MPNRTRGGDALSQIAAILAAGYLILKADSANSLRVAKLQSRKPVLSTCYSRTPEA